MSNYDAKLLLRFTLVVAVSVFSAARCDNIVVSAIDGDSPLRKRHEGPGEPLYLTKYIESERFEDGRRAALVQPLAGNVKSYSGYLTVNKECNSNLFFWYFQSEQDYRNAPTVVWLQGGPGSSMYMGVFNENGPYVLDKKRVTKRDQTWSKISNLIYFDNPVGTGYSFTDKESGYATDQTAVGRDLHAALVQLYKLFPHLRKNDLFVTGESYAGKYVPALGHAIHEGNKNKSETFIPLKGLMMGDGLSDPIHMLKYGDYLYQLGLIDGHVRDEFQRLESDGEKLIRRHKWNEASQLFERVIGNKTSLLYNATGFEGYYNYVDPKAGDWTQEETEFIASDHFRRRVHVGGNTLNNGSQVYSHLYDDIPKSVINWVVLLLRHYRVLYYNGQLDIICAYPLTENVLKNMKWSLKEEFNNAKRHIYRVNGDVAGYYKTAGNLTEVLIRNAGHMVPANQPVWAFQLFSDFVRDKFYRLPASGAMKNGSVENLQA